MRDVTYNLCFEELESERAAFEAVCPPRPYAEWNGQRYVYKVNKLTADKLKDVKPLPQHEFELWLVARGKATVGPIS